MDTITANPQTSQSSPWLRRRAVWLFSIFLGLVGIAVWQWSVYAAAESTPRPITGSVTSNGQPLESGKVEFRCQLLPDGQTNFTDAEVRIVNGQFEVDQEHGLVPGLYQVKIVRDPVAVESKNEVLTEAEAEAEDDCCSDEDDSFQTANEVIILVVVRKDKANHYTFELRD